jgi:hypothetical protein
VQRETACEALNLVERVQKILSEEHAEDAENIPRIGTRDLALLRTLVSIIFQWGTEPLFAQVASSWPNKSPSIAKHGEKIIDLTNTPENYALLTSFIARISRLFYASEEATLSQTHITVILLKKHAAAILKPCIALGWLPKSLASESTPSVASLRPFTTKLLNLYVPTV